MAMIKDLTNTTWVVPAGWSATAGYGRFYDIYYDIIYSDGIEDINYCRALFIGFSGPPNFENNEYDSFTKSIDNRITTYAAGKEITNDESFTITFTDGADTTNPDLISWLEANGECQNPPAPTVIISYDGNTLTTVEGGKTVTIHCADKMMTGDIEITAPEIPEVKLQEKTITENCEATPDEGYDGFSKVNVEVSIPGGYLVPSGTMEITENGNTDVSGLESITVNVQVDSTEVFDGTIIIKDPLLLNPSGTIPEGAIYTVASTGETLTAGTRFPATVASVDSYTYGDYKYVYYPISNGWEVSINTEVTDKNQETYGVILESINGVNVADVGSTFYNCTSLTTAPVIPEGVTNMDSTFYNCTSLTTAPVIPEGVTTMYSTFRECSSLKTYIGSTDVDGDFSDYVIPEGVTDMQYTFRNCTSLTTAPVIPEGVTSMNSTFYGCAELTGAITINATPTKYTMCLSGTQITEILGDCGNKEAILATK